MYIYYIFAMCQTLLIILHPLSHLILPIVLYAIIIPIWQMRKLKQNKNKGLSQNCKAKIQSHICLTPKPMPISLS